MTNETLNNSQEQSLDEVLKKHRGLGGLTNAAIKNPSTYLKFLKEYIVLLKEKESFLPNDAGSLILNNASTMTPEVANVLIQAGANIGIVDNKLNYNFVQKALLAQNHKLVVYALEQDIVSPNFREIDGTSLLMIALGARQFDFAEKLLDCKVNIDAQLTLPGQTDTALHQFAQKGDFQSVIWLIENGANPTIENAQKALASELVPAAVTNNEDNWNMDSMYDCLEEYRKYYESNLNNGDGYIIPHKMLEMAYLEHTPLSAREAEYKKYERMRKIEKPVSIIPKQNKKIGGF